jgi:hypothetical protein
LTRPAGEHFADIGEHFADIGEHFADKIAFNSLYHNEISK